MSRVIKHKVYGGFLIPADQVEHAKANFHKAHVVEQNGHHYLIPLLSSSDVVDWATRLGYIYYPGTKASNAQQM